MQRLPLIADSMQSQRGSNGWANRIRSLTGTYEGQDVRTRSVSRLGLAFVAILYCGVQWKYAANMGPHRMLLILCERLISADFAGDNAPANCLRPPTGACSANPSVKSRAVFFDEGDERIALFEDFG